MSDHGPAARLAAGTPGLRSLDVVLTSRCDLACGYCYQDAKQDRRMSWETLAGGIDLLLVSARDEVTLAFLGGEPLLEFGLIRRAVARVRARRRRRPRVSFAIATNGMRLDEGTARYLARHRFETQLSFDGVAAAQDLRRPGSFATLDRLLAHLRRRHPVFLRERLTVAVTVTSRSIEHLASSVAYFLDQGVRNLALSPVYTHDPGWTEAHGERLERAFDRILTRALEHYRGTGHIPLLLLRGSGAAERPAGPLRLTMCGAGRGETPTLDVDGALYGCATFARSYQTLASPLLAAAIAALRIGPLDGAATAHRLARYREACTASELLTGKQHKRSAYGRCGECRYLDGCRVCPTSIGHIPGNTDPRRVPDHLCAWNRASLAARDRFARAIGRAESPWQRIVRSAGAGEAEPPSGPPGAHTR